MEKIGALQLLDERRALGDMIKRMEASMLRGSEWLVGQFAPKGPIMRERDLSYCHKATWGLYEEGRMDAARKLLDWISENARMGVGRYGFPEEPPFNNEMQLLYRLLTFGMVAERLRHPSFANDETRKEILSYQHKSGGVWGNKDKSIYMRSLNPLVTSFFTEWAIAANLLGPAIKGADFLAMMVEENRTHMDGSPGRFYFNYDPTTEELVTKPEPRESLNCYVDTIKPKQHFYQIGTAMAALADMHCVTNERRYLDAALSLAVFVQRLNPEGLRWPSYCKIGWGAAELYAVTGSPTHRMMSANVSEITFMAAQMANGGWENMYYPLKDCGAWESVTYDGSGTVPSDLPDDGTWARLSCYEITGEFLAEMGRTLHVFKDAYEAIEQRLKHSIGTT